ncbi:hypothetical protein BDV29DRAFT_196515 [Aspergillus leporis]|uniref:Uncharacterized protein n=1 Tax=Aspergillus leporis TaxID=41062 RepID=A0A5N5WG96_9EURO|nr:hypothetical protein BDV29DRAFT_196515 [Aspergillus leporis]
MPWTDESLSIKNQVLYFIISICSSHILSRLRRRKEEQRRREEAEKHQKEAEQQLKPSSLFGLLDTCHNLLSQALCVETNATLTTQGGTTNTENRRFPHLIRPWSNFPTLQEKVWDKLNGDPTFTSARLFSSNHQLQRRVTLQDHPDAEHSALVSLEDALEHVHLDGSPHQVRRPTRGRRGRGAGLYAVEFKAPHKLTLPEIIAGLHEVDIARDVIDQQGDIFKFYVIYLVTTILTQLFFYMLNKVYVFTIIGQVLSFTLNTLVTEPPSQEWHNSANKRLSTWKLPSYWKPVNQLPYNTRVQANCQSNWTTPRHSSGESSGSTTDQVPGRQKRQAGRGRGCRQGRGYNKATIVDSNLSRRRTSRPYCTTICIHGLFAQDCLDPRCPNVHEHGVGRHPFGSKQYTVVIKTMSTQQETKNHIPSGVQVQNIANKENELFLQTKRQKLLEWRNMLWDFDMGRAFMIDFEDVSRMKRDPAYNSNTTLVKRKHRRYSANVLSHVQVY